MYIQINKKKKEDEGESPASRCWASPWPVFDIRISGAVSAAIVPSPRRQPRLIRHTGFGSFSLPPGPPLLLFHWRPRHDIEEDGQLFSNLFLLFFLKNLYLFLSSSLSTSDRVKTSDRSVRNLLVSRLQDTLRHTHAHTEVSRSMYPAFPFSFFDFSIQTWFV